MRDYYPKNAWWYAHNEPPKRFRAEVGNLVALSIRFNKWKEFLNPTNLATLNRLKGMISFRDNYATMTADFDCTARQLTQALRPLFRTPPTEDIKFVRSDIYDARAWTSFPLSAFIAFDDEFREPTPEERAQNRDWQVERRVTEDGTIVPMLHFAICNVPWTVTVDQFTVISRQEKHKPIAVMLFNHPELDRRFHAKDHGGRWVAQLDVPDGKKVSDMKAELFAEVEIKAAEHYCRIEPLATQRRLQGEPHIPLGPQLKT